MHYGEAAVTRAAVAALREGALVPDGVVIVDHAAEPLVLLEPEVVVVRPGTNGGYGAGLNVGLGVLVGRRVSPMALVVCMNNDVLVQADTLQQVATWWQHRDGFALTGARWGVVNLISGRTRLLETGTGPRWYERRYIDGAFMAAPLQAFLRAQTLPEDYFLYWEDVLFSERVRRAGGGLRLISGLQLAHDDHEPRDTTQVYYLVRNGARWLAEETTRPLRWWWWLANRGRWAYHGLRGTKPFVTQALRDATHRVGGKL